ncbi:hypothetical protein B0H17DRAFT_1197013 [Mycena rosella]|uniref:DUF6533 domain-containing protein n=1 Tax=Mycena rosella TaxID=1033263 RepID=A0AAD7DS04_MYCRO|nr:hypothetical protein B0H17DRAFT_1197013 [Mycena rosella]
MATSSPSPLEESESLPATRPLLLYLYFCAIVILYYDHLLTLPAEVAYIWRRAKTRSAYWFFLNRYLNFFCTLPIAVFNFVQFDHVRSVFARHFFPYSINITQLRQVRAFPAGLARGAVILSLRVYAMYGLNRRILYTFCLATVVAAGIAAWAISGQNNSRDLEDYRVRGCFLPLSPSSGTRESYLAAVWEALLAYDLLIFTMILTRSSKFWLRDRPPGYSTLHLMQRDGALYFVAMSLANLSNIISFYVGGPFTKGGLSTFATRYTPRVFELRLRVAFSDAPPPPPGSVSVTMTSRLILNLHAMANRGLYLSADRPHSNLRFVRANISESDE